MPNRIVARAALETLEDRRLLSAYMAGTVLHLDGTTSANTITLSQTAGSTGTFSTSIDSITGTFSKKGVTKIVIQGNSGNDKITVKGSDQFRGIIAIYGDAGNDTIYGSNFGDAIQGGAGDDRIYGRGGRDSILAGDGNDLVFGGPGNDRILGDAGNDTLYGDAGNDRIFGRADNDILGGDSEDLLIFPSLDDTPEPHVGNDHLEGNNGDDTILSHAGHDTLTGGRGADLLDSRTDSILQDKNLSEGDATPIQDFTVASTNEGDVDARIHLTIQVKTKSGAYKNADIPSTIGHFGSSLATIHSVGSTIVFQAPAGSTWKLGDVFRIWGVTFDSKHVGRTIVKATLPMTVTIGGTANTNYGNATLPTTADTTTEVLIKFG